MAGEVKQGFTAALEQLGVGTAPAETAEQSELFEADNRDAPMLVSSRAVGSKGGRPRGARNKRTEAWVDYLLGQYRSPLVGLLEIASRPAADLAREVGLYLYNEGKPVLVPLTDQQGNQLKDDKGELLFEHALATGEAFKGQIAALTAALPYIHQKLPLAIKVDQPPRGVLVIGDLNVHAAAAQGLELPLAPDEQNQGVIDAEPAQSDAQQSDAAPNALEYKDE